MLIDEIYLGMGVKLLDWVYYFILWGYALCVCVWHVCVAISDDIWFHKHNPSAIISISSPTLCGLMRKHRCECTVKKFEAVEPKWFLVKYFAFLFNNHRIVSIAILGKKVMFIIHLYHDKLFKDSIRPIWTHLWKDILFWWNLNIDMISF